MTDELELLLKGPLWDLSFHSIFLPVLPNHGYTSMKVRCQWRGYGWIFMVIYQQTKHLRGIMWRCKTGKGLGRCCNVTKALNFYWAVLIYRSVLYCLSQNFLVPPWMFYQCFNSVLPACDVKSFKWKNINNKRFFLDLLIIPLGCPGIKRSSGSEWADS